MDVTSSSEIYVGFKNTARSKIGVMQV